MTDQPKPLTAETCTCGNQLQPHDPLEGVCPVIAEAVKEPERAQG